MVRFLAVLTALAAAVLVPPGAPAGAAPAAPPALAAGVAVAGGDQLTSPSGRCTLAFNITGRRILAGHCGPAGTRWYAGTTPVGVTETVLSGSQVTVIRIDNPAVVQLHGVRGPGGLITISSAARSYVGQPVTAVSRVSGLRAGTVTGINQTVYYAGGVIYGLDRSSVCPDAGGSGTPIFAGSVALSIAVGGSGNCTTGGTTYSQPVVPLLALTGQTIY